MSLFHIIEHKVPAQHIREYPNATANSQEELLYLKVKQYTPKDGGVPQRGDVTIIGAHANGFPKELYEPLWDDLLRQARELGWRIRSIWIADVSHQGQSGIVNHSLLGNDPNWNDHARDLLHLINQKRDQMPRPIIGIGHSMGGAQISYLALMHPRLLSTLVLIDPTMQPIRIEGTRGNSAWIMAVLAAYRRTSWPSREAAATSFKKSPYYQAWDPRVLDKWIEHGLRDADRESNPDASKSELTLTTPVAQEVFSYLRPNFDAHGAEGRPMNRITHPDIDSTGKLMSHPFYRPELQDIFSRVSQLRPSALYITGAESPVTAPALRQRLLSRTGTSTGGSGGAAEGRVKGVVIDRTGHLVAMEDPTRTAHAAAAWIADELRRLREEDEKWEKEWKSTPMREKQELDEMWIKTIGKPPKRAKI